MTDEKNPTEKLDSIFPTVANDTSESKGNGFTYVPATFDAARDWADYVSRSGMVPDAFRTPAGAPKDASRGRDVYLACARGAELGMKPLQSLMNIAVVNGRTTLSTDAKKALCMKYGDIKSQYDDSDGIPKWTCTATRQGHADVTITFSAQDAVVAGLMACEWVDNPNGKGKIRIWKGRTNAWVHYWKRMLLKRAMSWCCDEAFPDVLSGFGTTEDYSEMNVPAATTESIAQSVMTPKAERKTREKPTPVEAEAEIIEEEPNGAKYNPNTGSDFFPILDAMEPKPLNQPPHTSDLYVVWAQRFLHCVNHTELQIVANALNKSNGLNPFDSSALRNLYKELSVTVKDI